MKWLEVTTEPDDIRGALARLGLAPRAPPKPPSRALFGQLSLPFGTPADRVPGADPPAEADLRPGELLTASASDVPPSPA